MKLFFWSREFLRKEKENILNLVLNFPKSEEFGRQLSPETLIDDLEGRACAGRGRVELGPHYCQGKGDGKQADKTAALIALEKGP